MKEPTIVKRSFPSNRHFDYDDQRKEASTEGKFPGFGTGTSKNKSCTTFQINKRKKRSLSTQITNQMKRVHINTQFMPVSSLEDVPANMTTLTIPAATYAVFTTRRYQLLKSFARLGNIFGNGQRKTNVLLQQTLSFMMKER